MTIIYIEIASSSFTVETRRIIMAVVIMHSKLEDMFSLPVKINETSYMSTNLLNL